MRDQLEEMYFPGHRRPDGYRPFDPDEFATAFAWAMNVVNGGRKDRQTVRRRLTLVE